MWKLVRYSKNFTRKFPEDDRPRFFPRKSWKSIFNLQILELMGNIDIILNEFQRLFYTGIQIWVKYILAKILEIPGFQPKHLAKLSRNSNI